MLIAFILIAYNAIPPLKAVNDTHTSGVGTEAYAAPEQLSGGVLTEKSDIFSLGILLFELLCVFNTAMERAVCFDDLRKRRLPDAIVKQYPKEVCRR